MQESSPEQAILEQATQVQLRRDARLQERAQRRRRTSPRAVIDTTIPSPCISICQMEGAYCKGCLRSIDEIREWIVLSAQEKQAILQQIALRRTAL